MEIVKEVRKAFHTGKTRDLKWRKDQLHALHQMLVDHEKEAIEALAKDLHKPKAESYMAELNVMKLDISSLIHNVDRWAKPQKVSKTMLTMTDTCYVQKQPFGVALIVGPWNYPLLLLLVPLAGAIVAGNCAILKPSELASASEQFIAKYLPEYLDKDCFRVYCGGVQETTDLLKERFDIIFYTGNTNVGKIVMAAAAKFLTPVILELGGKSPVYVSESADLSITAHRIAWGKLSNCGQTCVAPDYVLCHESVKDKLIEKYKAVVTEFYGTKISESDDYGRIINDRHFSRISKMLSSTKGNTLRIGEDEANMETKFIPPVVITDVDGDDSVMQEEIFGPVLPIMSVRNKEEAISFINDREKPLALYVFSSNNSDFRSFEEKTSSGGLLFNDTIMHCAVDGLPFGGVGNSGMGNYHGQYSFDAFSHKRACMNKCTNETVNNMGRYPPYTDKKLNMLNWAMGSNPKGNWCSIM